MKVLTMQLNSITIMDIIAYGGAALGVFFSVTQSTRMEKLILPGFVGYFAVCRFLYSDASTWKLFHIAMNGMAASDKIFRFLELPEAPKKAAEFPKMQRLSVKISVFL